MLKEMKGPHKRARQCRGSLFGEAAVPQCLLGSEADRSVIQKLCSWERTLENSAQALKRVIVPLLAVGRSWPQPECP